MFKIPSLKEIDELQNEIEQNKVEISCMVDEVIEADEKEGQVSELSPEHRGKIAGYIEEIANHYQQEVMRLSSYIRHSD